MFYNIKFSLKTNKIKNLKEDYFVMNQETEVIEKQDVVIRFSGDSGDGMQLTGQQFSDTAALFGNDVSTFPDYPAEIRAPQGTVGGVSGFQVHIGEEHITTPGDFADVLVAMNPAALKANLRWAKKAGTIILDTDAFTDKHLERAGYTSNPLTDHSLDDYNVIAVNITKLTIEALKETGLDQKSVLRCKNMFALGMTYWMFERSVEHTEAFFDMKFAKKPSIASANKLVLRAGYNYAANVHALAVHFKVAPAHIEKGKYRTITGNKATAWGLLAAAEKAGLPLFCGSYPITPATDILQELALRRDLGAKTYQAEDEIGGICTAIGASYAGNFAVTTTSGPGLALKSEACGLAVMAELPLVIVDVQRGGPSTGLPTKTEQSDLMQALYGRNGESPMPVIAASTSGNCFDYAFIAGKIALEHMTPVILLTDGFLANGAQPWLIPSMAKLPEIKIRRAKEGDNYQPYARDPETLARTWAVPGTKGLEHRIGGLEKMNITGTISYVPENHQVMTDLRQEKVARIANYIPQQEVFGNPEGGEVLVVGWGGTYGHLFSAVKELRKEGKDVSLAHFNYINPLPKNTQEVLAKFKKILVCELNLGQFAAYLRSKYPEFTYQQYNKVAGLPFTVLEIKEEVNKLMND
ncbi:MFS transporter [Odoribacter laneus]|jgi:2-oxoacid:acceptor oxidoreductase, alpha subunit|uniref:2-oxoacid:acceptor oxidoreductase, alpha subunit n=2 Tax=Odoribacter laneus TaxID=626933 RepID=H1DK71_9BACT|nr:2-oxoacid:acceptor oxidoreductase, alpha subunit [Odoribacter laneus YIT 12061]GKI23176.1 MFS transporter [Odoribacter laneus]GKI26968.1 MFS transporter [Odoribacter laneus]CCZ80869.1 2-oxoacid:acceptor oxidoreductase alpha subunit [Odoribacter laneus CAG:561]